MKHKFHTVKIKEIQRETSDTITVEFDIPDHLESSLLYEAGQYLTLRTQVNGEEMQRPYSLSTAPYEKKWEVAIKKTEDGAFSQFAHEHFEVGQPVDIMGPEGHFTIKTKIDQSKRYVFFAAGSGITPVISLIKEVLDQEPNSYIQLFYGNKKFSTIIFYRELQELQSAHADRFDIEYFFSEEPMKDALYCGRLDVSKCTMLAEKMVLDIPGTDEIYLCGPEEMIFDLKKMFVEEGVSEKNIHFELFESELGNKLKYKEASMTSNNNDMSEVTITLDGEEHVLMVPFDDLPILEYVLDEGYPAPFSCLGGACCSCRAKLIEGEVEMIANFSLDEEEVEEGYRLTCQSMPKSAKIHLDYDQ